MRDHHTQDKEQVVPQYLVLNHWEDNNYGIDLLKLISELYKKRVFIIIFTALCTVLAASYLLFGKPQYQIKINLFQPRLEQLQQLYLHTETTLTKVQLFQQFLKKLANKSNLDLFLKEQILHKKIKRLSKSNQWDFIFDNMRLTPVINVFDNSLEAVLTYTSNNIQSKTKKIIDYIAFTNKQVSKDIIKEQKVLKQQKIKTLEKEIEQELSKIKYMRNRLINKLKNEQSLKIAIINNQIEALRNSDIRNRKLRLEELNDAIRIAQSVKYSSNEKGQKDVNKKLFSNKIRINDHLYLLGTSYLENEIARVKARPHSMEFEKKLSSLEEELYIIQHNPHILHLTNRINDKPYTKFLIEKNEQLNNLKNLSFNKKETYYFYLKGTPTIEKINLKHNKVAITLLASILGFIVAIFFVLMQIFFRSHIIHSANKIPINN